MRANVTMKTVKENFEQAIQLSKNLKPIFVKIIGQENDKNEWTVRGGIAKSFVTKTDAKNGSQWDLLKESTLKQKSKKYAGAPSLIASGTMFRSLVGNGPGNVYILGPRTFKYGTSVPYTRFHMTGTKFMAKRRMLGITTKQRNAWKKLIVDYYLNVLRGGA